MVLHENSHGHIYSGVYKTDQLHTAGPSVKKVKKFLKRPTEQELIVMGHAFQPMSGSGYLALSNQSVALKLTDP